MNQYILTELASRDSGCKADDRSDRRTACDRHPSRGQTGHYGKTSPESTGKEYVIVSVTGAKCTPSALLAESAMRHSGQLWIAYDSITNRSAKTTPFMRFHNDSLLFSASYTGSLSMIDI